MKGPLDKKPFNSYAPIGAISPFGYAAIPLDGLRKRPLEATINDK